MEQRWYQKFSYWVEVSMDLVLVNLLWLACCLPVITIGASTTAMHYVVRKMAAGEPYKVWSGFWQSFRQNFKQGTALWLILAIAGTLCGADGFLGSQMDGTLGTLCQAAGILGTIAVLGSATLVFPLLARYTQTTMQLLKSALLLAVGNIWIVIAGCLTAVMFPALTLWKASFGIVAIPMWILTGGSLSALVVQLLLRPVYAKLEHTAL